MTYEVTKFHNLGDNIASKISKFESWDNLVTSFKKSSEIIFPSKESAFLISPAKFDPPTRSNANVIYWNRWVALDIDNPNVKLQDMVDKFKDYNNIFYSTASCREHHLKYRIVIELDKIVSKENITWFWNAINKFIGNAVDKQTKDHARMFYVPGKYQGAYNFFLENKGIPLNTHKLMKRYSFFKEFPEHINEPLYDNLIRYKRSLSEHINWENYKDCPFVNQNLVNDYFKICHTDGNGRYCMIYSMMVSIANRAKRMGYIITEDELVKLIKEIDRDGSNIYSKRPLKTEAKNAIKFVNC